MPKLEKSNFSYCAAD